MMFGSNVAPKRKVIAKKYVPWACRCTADEPSDYKVNPGYLTHCIDCGEKRP